MFHSENLQIELVVDSPAPVVKVVVAVVDSCVVWVVIASHCTSTASSKLTSLRIMTILKGNSAKVLIQH